MRTTGKRTLSVLLVAVVAGGAALALTHPVEPPAVIPPADHNAARFGDEVPLPIIPAVATRTMTETTPAIRPVQATQAMPKTDPAVTLEWVGPAVVKVNQPAEYTLSVKNACGQALQKVVVQVRVPKDVTVKTTAPEVKPTDHVYLWELDTLDAKATKSVKMTVSQATKGDLNCQAWVTFTGTASMKATVKEPKLTVNIRVPETVMIGDRIPVEYVVTNPGDCNAEGVVLKLTNSATPTMAARTLKPGEAHKMTDEFISTTGGRFTYEAIATGDDGLKSSEKATVMVQMPKVDCTIAGPDDRLIGKKAAYTITVRNTGDVPATGVVVRGHVPGSFRIVSTGADGVLASRADQVSWPVGTLAAGAVKKLDFDGICTQAGGILVKCDLAGERGLKANAECRTKVEGIPALRLEMVDSVDPVEKAGETVCEIKVTNTGTKSDTNVCISCLIPKEFEFVSASGPTKGTKSLGIKVDDPNHEAKQHVVFEPITELPPKMEATFKVKAKAVKTGDARFKVEMTSKQLTSPVVKEESTRVYGE